MDYNHLYYGPWLGSYKNVYILTIDKSFSSEGRFDFWDSLKSFEDKLKE